MINICKAILMSGAFFVLVLAELSCAVSDRSKLPSSSLSSSFVATTLSHIPSPQLIIEPPGINFFTEPGIDPPAENLVISAISGPLNWSLTRDAPWLTVSPVKGKALSGKENVMVSVSNAGLAAGVYSTNIVFHQEKNDWAQDIPVRLFLSTFEFDKLPTSIKVEKGMGTAFKQGILLEKTDVNVGVITDQPGENSQGGGYYGIGDPCFVISGEMRNPTGKALTVDFWADGFGKDGRQISWTLSQGPLIGIAQKDIIEHHSSSFELNLSWAENVNYFQISANIHNKP